MKTFDFTVKDELGIHAKPAALLAKDLKKRDSEVTITFGEEKADGKDFMAIMNLGVKHGGTIGFSVNGGDEEDTVTFIEAFLNANL